jgi:hypothetical protein
MKNEFRDVLNSIDPKQGSSCLEPYGGFVDELRRQGFTCRDITLYWRRSVSSKRRKVLSAGRCERVGNGRPPAKGSRHVAIPPPDRSQKGGIAFWARTE